MLPESPIIVEPDLPSKLAIGAHDQELVHRQITPPKREVGHQHHFEDREGLDPREDIVELAPIASWGRSEDHSAIEEQLRLRVWLLGVSRQQIHKLDEFSRDD